MTDQEVLQIFYKSNGKINSLLTRHTWLIAHPDIHNYLLNRYPDSTQISEILYRIKHDIDVRPTCVVCGKPVNFIGELKGGYRQTCSVKCAKQIVNHPISGDICDPTVILSDIVENGKLNNNKLQDSYLITHGYYNYIQSIYTDATSKSEKLYRLYNNITTVPVCKFCGKASPFKNFNEGYNEFCNDICENKYHYMLSNITDNDIINLLFKNNQPIYARFNTAFLKSYNIYDYLKHRYTDSHRISEIIYRIKNNIDVKPICKICGKPAKFISPSKGYSDACSSTCKYKLSSVTECPVDIEINDTYIKEHYLNNISNIQNGTALKPIMLMKAGVYSYLKNRYSDSSSVAETVYRIKYDITIRPVCPICGKTAKFLNIHQGFKLCCSQKCTVIDKTQKYYSELLHCSVSINMDGNIVNLKNYCEKHPNISISKQTFYRRLNNNENLCPICNPHNTTTIEDKIISILNKHNIQYYIHDRVQIYPYEIDIYLPEYSIGIECNGIYWHTIDKVSKDAHIKKMQLCNDKNITLLHFWENDINDSLTAVEHTIMQFINPLRRHNNVRICDIDKKIRAEFINEHMLQSSILHKTKINTVGIYINDELVSIADYMYENNTVTLLNIKDISVLQPIMVFFKNKFNIDNINIIMCNDLCNKSLMHDMGFIEINEVINGVLYFDKYGKRIYNHVRNACFKCYNSGYAKYSLKNKD